MCRLLGGVGRPRYLLEFFRIARRDCRGRSHPDGWGYAVYKDNMIVTFKTLYPPWERPKDLPSGKAFLVHVRRGEKVGRSLDHVQPHICNGVVLAHNGGASIPFTLLKEFYLPERTTSERLACLFGRLVERFGAEDAIAKLTAMVRPTPSANLIALIPKERILVALNYHNGDSYYVMWEKEGIFSSEPLGEGWRPLSENGKPVWRILKF